MKKQKTKLVTHKMARQLLKIQNDVIKDLEVLANCKVWISADYTNYKIIPNDK